MWSKKYLLAAAMAPLVLSAPAMGQNLYQDIQREFADENQLQRDVRRYQHDVATGHFLRAAADRARIQNDEANLRYDQALVQNDLASPGAGRPALYQGQSLIPHPQYPGYFYYPSQPGQLYYYGAGQPVPPQVAAPVAPAPFVGPVAPPTFVGPPSPAALGNGTPSPLPSSSNPVTFNVAPPLKTITVLISNPAETGVPINFAVDGTAYNVPSGYAQKLVTTAGSLVEFDRGDLFGDARYSLSDGYFEFRYTDKGWELYKKQPKSPTPLGPATGALPRNVPPRSIASTAIGGPSTIEALPSSTSEVVPPAPVPAPAPDPTRPR